MAWQVPPSVRSNYWVLNIEKKYDRSGSSIRVSLHFNINRPKVSRHVVCSHRIGEYLIAFCPSKLHFIALMMICGLPCKTRVSEAPFGCWRETTLFLITTSCRLTAATLFELQTVSNYVALFSRRVYTLEYEVLALARYTWTTTCCAENSFFNVYFVRSVSLQVCVSQLLRIRM